MTEVKRDISSGVLQIISGVIAIPLMVLSIVFGAINGKPLFIVMSSLFYSWMFVYSVLSSISSFCGTVRAINVMLRIERAFYALFVSLYTSSISLFYFKDFINWKMAGFFWGLSILALIYGVLTGRRYEVFYQAFNIFQSIFILIMFLVFKISVLFLIISLILIIVAQILFIFGVKNWNRFIAFFIQLISVFLFFFVNLFFLIKW